MRQKQGLSQEKMANILKITQQAYSHYELGKREADYATLLEIANYFNVSTDYLLGKSNIPAQSSEALELLDIMYRRGELKILFSLAVKATKEDIDVVNTLLKRMLSNTQ